MIEKQETMHFPFPLSFNGLISFFSFLFSQSQCPYGKGWPINRDGNLEKIESTRSGCRCNYIASSYASVYRNRFCFCVAVWEACGQEWVLIDDDETNKQTNKNNTKALFWGSWPECVKKIVVCTLTLNEKNSVLFSIQSWFQYLPQSDNLIRNCYHCIT